MKIHVKQILALILALAPERVDRRACRCRTRFEDRSGGTERAVLDGLRDLQSSHQVVQSARAERPARATKRCP